MILDWSTLGWGVVLTTGWGILETRGLVMVAVKGSGLEGEWEEYFGDGEGGIQGV